MSFINMPKVRKAFLTRMPKKKKDFVTHQLPILLNIQDFSTFRDYYIKIFSEHSDTTEYLHSYNVERFGGIDSLSTLPTRTLATMLTKLVDAACKEPGDADRKRIIEKLSDDYNRIVAEANTTPYQKIGEIMHAFLAVMKTEKMVKVSHHAMRNWMNNALGVAICDHFKKHPEEPIWRVAPSSTMKTITAGLAGQTTLTPLEKAFTEQLYERSNSIRKTYPSFAKYPKSDDQVREEATNRKKILEALSPGQLLVTLPWMANGFQYNGFSWRNFRNFAQRHYVLTQTQETFDKSFFCSWVSRCNGDEIWENPAHEKKFFAASEAAYLEWLKIAKIVIPQVPRLVMPQRMTSLPKSVCLEIVKDAVTSWTGLAASENLKHLLNEAAESDVLFSLSLEQKRGVVSFKDVLGMLNHPLNSRASINNEVLKTSTESWPIDEHILLRDVFTKEVDFPNMPETLIGTDFV